MTALGYSHEIVYLNSMFAHLMPTAVAAPDDFAPQSRDRMYVVFWKDGIRKPNLQFRPLAYCVKCDCNIEAVQSWKKGRVGGVYGGKHGQYVYCCPTCAQAVNPYYYCAANAIDFTNKGQRIGDRKRPLKPKTLRRIEIGLERFGGQGVLVPQAYSHGHDNRAVAFTSPVPTQTTRQDVGVAFPPYLLQYYTRDNALSQIEEALPTVTTEPRHALITPPFIAEFRKNQAARGIDEPFTTVETSGAHHGLVMPPFLTVQYTPGYSVPITEPMGTVTTNDHHALVTPPPFLMSYYGSNGCYQDVFEEAAGTVTTKDRHALVHPGIPDVEDCHFRMLTPAEIGRAMGFHPDYRVVGTKKEQVQQYGNAVTPVAMKRLIERCLEVL